jgi:hypothetical protein
MRAGKPGLERVKRCLARLPPVDLLIVGSGGASAFPSSSGTIHEREDTQR